MDSMMKINTIWNILLMFFLNISYFSFCFAQNIDYEAKSIAATISATLWQNHLANNKEVILSSEEAIVYSNYTEKVIDIKTTKIPFRSKVDCFQRNISYYEFQKICKRGNKITVCALYYPKWVKCYYNNATTSYSLKNPPAIKLKVIFSVEDSSLVTKKYLVKNPIFDAKEASHRCLEKQYKSIH